MKYIMPFAAAVLLASCSSIRSTSESVDVQSKVSSYPTVADLHVSSQRVSRSTSWKWNPFNTTSLKARKGNLKAELVNEAGADILVEPEFMQRTSFLNLCGGSLTVSGYPAKLDNFRRATPADIAALQAAGMLYGKGKNGGGDVYFVIGERDIEGLVIGKTPVQEETADPTHTPKAPATSTETVGAQDQTGQVIPASTDTKSASSTSQPSTNSHKPTSVNTHRTAADNSHNPAAANSNQPVSANSHKPIAPLGYDAIGTSRFLTTMAKEYYGNPDFWPYIYQENQAKFGHPDRIKPGTTVVIPNLNKYGVDPRNPEDIDKAKKLGKEIYTRYGK